MSLLEVSYILIRFFCLHHLEVESEVADKTAGIRPRSFVERNTGVLEAFKNDFKQLPLLRIHVSGLEIIDAEETVLELPNIIFEEVATLRHDAAWTVHAVGVIEAVDVESRFRDIALCGSTRSEKIPELLGRGAVSGQSASWGRLALEFTKFYL